jgi:uncharacterized cupin superfamily protein
MDAGDAVRVSSARRVVNRSGATSSLHPSAGVGVVVSIGRTRMSNKITAPAMDPASVAPRTGSTYPKQFRTQIMARSKRALGDALGLTHFGINLVELQPGAWSSQRHWHSAEDEFVYVVSGEVTLVTDVGRQVLGAGMVAGFPAGAADGHHLVNASAAPAVYLEVGDRRPEDDEVRYPDIDMVLTPARDGRVFRHNDGRPYDVD